MIEIPITDNHCTVMDILVYLERQYPNTINVSVRTSEFGCNRMNYTIIIEDKSK